MTSLVIPNKREEQAAILGIVCILQKQMLFHRREVTSLGDRKHRDQEVRSEMLGLSSADGPKMLYVLTQKSSSCASGLGGLSLEP